MKKSLELKEDVSIESRRSSHREALLEHLFAGEIMKCLWLAGQWRLELLKPQVDDGGYDLVLEANDVVRHVQLKATFRGAKVRRWNVNALLEAKPSGCVVCVQFDRSTLQFTDFYFFGGPPGKKIPSLGKTPAKHTKANAKGVKTDRPNIRVLRLSSFQKMGSIQELVERLFGKANSQGVTA